MSMQGRVVWAACVLTIAWSYPGQEAPVKKGPVVLEGRQILIERDGGSIDLSIKDSGLVRLSMASSKGDRFDLLVGDRVSLSMTRENGARFELVPGKDGRYQLRCGQGEHQAVMGRMGVRDRIPYYGIAANDAKGREVFHLTDSMDRTASFMLLDEKGKIGVIAHAFNRGGFLRLTDSRSGSHLICKVYKDWERMIILRKDSEVLLGQISSSDKKFEILLKDPSRTRQGVYLLDRNSAPALSLDK